MISMEKCRELIGEKAESMTDDEIARIREDLYGLAELALESYFEKKKNE